MAYKEVPEDYVKDVLSDRFMRDWDMERHDKSDVRGWMKNLDAIREQAHSIGMSGAWRRTMEFLKGKMSSNSAACNAKFKVGQSVEVSWIDGNYDTGKVESEDSDYVWVKLDHPYGGGKQVVQVRKGLVSANANACNRVAAGEAVAENMSAQQAVTAIELLMPFSNQNERYEAEYMLKQYGSMIRSSIGERAYRDLENRVYDA